MIESHLGYLFDNNEVDPIKYLEDNTDMLTKFNKEDIKTIMADTSNTIYILLNNKKLYITGADEPIELVDCIHMLDYGTHFAITVDKEIICLNNNHLNNYFKGIKFDKVLIYLFGIIGLKDGEVKGVYSWYKTSYIVPERFKSVDDIKIDDDEAYVLQNDEWLKLFED